jgi:hypothetical protein
MQDSITKIERFFIFFGFSILLFRLLPINIIINKFSHLIFMHLSTTSFYSVTVPQLIGILLCFLLVWIIFRQLNIFDRLEPNYTSLSLFIVGSIVYVIIYLTSHYSDSIPFLHMLKKYMTTLNYVSIFSSLCIYTACARVLIGIEPERD